MRKLFKKSLACVLAVALCLTAMVGALVVSADVQATITVGTANVAVGATSAGSNVGLIDPLLFKLVVAALVLLQYTLFVLVPAFVTLALVPSAAFE